MMKFVCAVLLLAAVAVADEVQTGHCGGHNAIAFSRAHIEGCSGSGVCTIQRAVDTEIILEFLSDHTITGGTYIIEGEYLGIKIEITNKPLCNGMSCSLPPGSLVVHRHVMNLSSSVPAIKTTAKVQVIDESGVLLLCRSLEIQVA